MVLGLAMALGAAAVAAGTGAGYAGLAWVRQEKGPARRWLFEAVKEGDAGKVKRILALGIDIDAKDEYERTALHDACYYGHTEIAQLLIDAGADESLVDQFGHTPREDAQEKQAENVLSLLDSTSNTPRSARSPRTPRVCI